MNKLANTLLSVGQMQDIVTKLTMLLYVIYGYFFKTNYRQWFSPASSDKLFRCTAEECQCCVGRPLLLQRHKLYSSLILWHVTCKFTVKTPDWHSDISCGKIKSIKVLTYVCLTYTGGKKYAKVLYMNFAIATLDFYGQETLTMKSKTSWCSF